LKDDYEQQQQQPACVSFQLLTMRPPSHFPWSSLGLLLQLLILCARIECSICSWPKSADKDDTKDDIIRKSPLFSERLKMFRNPDAQRLTGHLASSTKVEEEKKEEEDVEYTQQGWNTLNSYQNYIRILVTQLSISMHLVMGFKHNFHHLSV
jgi:hypothetical protein